MLFYLANQAFPVTGLGDVDEVDVYGTFTEKEAMILGIVPVDTIEVDLGEKTTLDRVDEVKAQDTSRWTGVKTWLKG